MNPQAITITLLMITAGSLICSIILWRMLTAQNNKAQAAYATHRKEHKTILSKSKAERRDLKLVLNAFDDALIITNASGIIQVANEATKILCEGRELRGKSITSAFLNDEICKHIAEAILNNEAQKQNILLTETNFGQKNAVEDSAWIIDYAPLPVSDITENTEPPLHRVILRNVTTEHRTDQIKREFVANASHELRTPLAIISGYLENLIDDDVVDSPATARRLLATMRKHSERIALLIEEMLIISKLESGESAQLASEPFLLNNTITTVIERLSPVIQNQHAIITTGFDPKLIHLTGDAFYWEQALFNIIENALKQNTKSPVHISISARELNGQLTIEVSDNGKGIPSAHLPYIFNRFYRVQKHHSQNEVKGTGLGLSIVKHAIEAHGGTITATSKPGINTTFTINVTNSSPSLN